jgi:hypothetical protein
MNETEGQQAGEPKEKEFQAILDVMPSCVYLGYGRTDPTNVETDMPEKVVAVFNFSEKRVRIRRDLNRHGP